MGNQCFGNSSQSQSSKHKKQQFIYNARIIPSQQKEQIQFPTDLQKCFGIIKMAKTQKRDERILGLGVAIGSKMVLTTVETIYNKKTSDTYTDMKFVTLWEKSQYNLSDDVFYTGFNSKISEENNKLNTCVVVLKEKIKEWQVCRLAFKLPKIVDHVYFPVIKYHESDFFEPCFKKTTKFSIKESESVIEFQNQEAVVENGAPIAIFYEDSLYIIGIKGSIHKQNNILCGRIFDQYSIERFVHFSIILRSVELQAFYFEGEQMRSMQPYIQEQLKITQEKSRAMRQRYESQTEEERFKNAQEMISGDVGVVICGMNIQSITVNGVTLYFEIFSPQKIYTVADLKQQYLKTKRRSLVLVSKQLKIPSEIPLAQIMQSQQQIQSFQIMLNSLNKNQSDKRKVSPKYLNKLNKAISRFCIRTIKKGNEILVKNMKEDEPID